MSLDCLGSPADWARVLDVAARCTGTTTDQAGQLAGLGALSLVLPLFVVLVAIALVRARR